MIVTSIEKILRVVFKSIEFDHQNKHGIYGVSLLSSVRCLETNAKLGGSSTFRVKKMLIDTLMAAMKLVILEQSKFVFQKINTSTVYGNFGP